MFAHPAQKQRSLLQQAWWAESRVKGQGSRVTGPRGTGAEGLTIKGEVADELGRLVAARRLQERQQLGPELPQISLLLPRSYSCDS